MDNKEQLAAVADCSVYKLEQILSTVNYLMKIREDYRGCEWQFMRDLNVDLKNTIKTLQYFSGALDRYVEFHVEK